MSTRLIVLLLLQICFLICYETDCMLCLSDLAVAGPTVVQVEVFFSSDYL